MSKSKTKFSFFTILKYFFYFILIVIHFNLIRGTLEIIPALFPSLSEQVTGTISGKNTKTSRSSGPQSKQSNHSTISYYVDVKFNIKNEEYNNTDLVEERVYDNLKDGQQVAINYLKGFPQVAIMEVNKSYGIKNHLLLTLILIGVDIIVFLIWRWIRRYRASLKSNKK